MDTKWIQKRAKKSNFFSPTIADMENAVKIQLLSNSNDSMLKNGYKMDTKKSKKEQKRARLKNQKIKKNNQKTHDISSHEKSAKNRSKMSIQRRKSGFKRTKPLNKRTSNNDNVFFCEYCNFSTDHKYNYQRHLKTKKHKNMVQQYQNQNLNLNQNLNQNQNHPTNSLNIHHPSPTSINIPTYNNNHHGYDKHKNQCVCGKKYKYQSGLYKHIKKCDLYRNQYTKNMTSFSNHNGNINESERDFFKKCMEKITDENFLTNLIKDKINIQQNIINNTQNNHFNVHFFLNETCKNAMNLSDFMNTIETCQKNWNMMLTENNMYESFSNLVIHELNELDVTKRPIHCMDKKRKIVYIKDNNLWEKDNNCEKLSHAIQDMSIKAEETTNGMIKQWRENNPEWKHNNEKSDMLYTVTKNQMDFTNQSKGNKLVNRVINTTMIDKNIPVENAMETSSLLTNSLNNDNIVENIVITSNKDKNND